MRVSVEFLPVGVPLDEDEPWPTLGFEGTGDALKDAQRAADILGRQAAIIRIGEVMIFPQESQ